jgi:hypothetical protein
MGLILNLNNPAMFPALRRLSTLIMRSTRRSSPGQEVSILDSSARDAILAASLCDPAESLLLEGSGERGTQRAVFKRLRGESQVDPA